MRIQDKTTINTMGKKSKTLAKATDIINSLFAGKLSTQMDEQHDLNDDIESLKNSIDSAGEKLDAEPTLTNFANFRGLLSKLAKKLNSEAYRLEKTGGTPQNPRYYETISVIDREADQLYALLVKTNHDRLAITAKIIGIKGLVVDLIT